MSDSNGPFDERKALIERMGNALSNDPLCMMRIKQCMEEDAEKLAEALRLLGLINAEWKSDPTSVACFDLGAIVCPVRELLA